MKSKSLGLLAVGLLFAPMAGWAGVIYEWTGPPLHPLSFSYTHPTFITAVVIQCDMSGLEVCSDINFLPDSSWYIDDRIDHYDVVTLSEIIAVGVGSNTFYYFPNEAFLHFGSYTSQEGSQLVVRPELSVVPEPPPLVLLGLGLAGLGRRRRGN